MFKIGHKYRFKDTAALVDFHSLAVDSRSNNRLSSIINLDTFEVTLMDSDAVTGFRIGDREIIAGNFPIESLHTILLKSEFHYFEEVKAEPERTFIKYVVIQGVSVAYIAGNQDDANEQAKILKLECPDLTVEVFGLLATASLDVKLA